MPLTAPLPFRRRPLVGLPLTWAALVLVLTLTPAKDMPAVPPWELISFDTAAHAFVFFILAVLSYFSAARQLHLPWLRQHAFALMLLGGILFGALIEVLQMSMHLGRHGEWSDLIGDALGTFTGLLLLRAVRRWWA
jgi:VanZ family protein